MSQRDFTNYRSKKGAIEDAKNAVKGVNIGFEWIKTDEEKEKYALLSQKLQQKKSSRIVKKDVESEGVN